MLPSKTLTLLVVVGCISVAAAQQRTASDTDLLRTKGLRLIANSSVWGVRDEARLRSRSEQLAELKKRIQAHEKVLDERIQQNRRRWERLKQMETTLRAQAVAGNSNAAQRRQLEKQRNSLRSQAVAPDKLGGFPDVQSRLIELTNDRHQLAISLVWIREALSRLSGTYDQLRNDDAATRAIAGLGPPNKLGPLTDFDRVLKSTREYNPLVSTSAVPLYLQSERIRFGGIVNERYPVTFSWNSKFKHVTITTNMAESAGLEIPENAKQMVLNVEGGRKLTTRLVSISYLRLGRHLIRDVDAYVLPPQAEDLGAQFGANALEGYRVQPEPQRLRMTVLVK